MAQAVGPGCLTGAFSASAKHPFFPSVMTMSCMASCCNVIVLREDDLVGHAGRA
jgi:hypothetical protein